MISGGFFSPLVCSVEDLALLVEHRGRHAGRIHVGRVDRRDVHGEIPRQRFVAALQRDQRADARAVHVGAQRPRRRDAHEAAHRDVLADLGDQGAALILEGARAAVSAASSASRRPAECVSAALATSRANAWNSSPRATKSVSQLTSTSTALGPERSTATRAFGGDPRGLLVGLREPALAHELGGRVQIALGLDQRLLALHHAGAGALAQLFD